MSSSRAAPAPPPPPRQLYFAYGSNLWLKQMAGRCPESYYMGRAVLPDYRWQINERGFANIIPCSGHSVHGLVYELGPGDEAALDRMEGVHLDLYSKTLLSVVLHAADPTLQLSTRGIVADGGPGPPRPGRARHGRGGVAAPALSPPEQPPRLAGCVLVYLSDEYVMSAEPRDEYVDRMNHGIRDAVALGVPADFFDNAVRSYIPDAPVLRRATRRLTRRVAPEPPGRSSRAQSQSRTQGRGDGRRRARSMSAEPRNTRTPEWEARRASSPTRSPNRLHHRYVADRHFAELSDRTRLRTCVVELSD